MTQIRIHGHKAVVEEMIYINSDGLKYLHLRSFKTRTAAHLDGRTGWGVRSFYDRKVPSMP